MAATIIGVVAPAFCVRCGSARTEVLGDTLASRFFSCRQCCHVWGVRRDTAWAGEDARWANEEARDSLLVRARVKATID